MTEIGSADASLADTVRVRGTHALHGTLRVPGDKSISHRSLMFAALADGTSTIRGLSHGADVRNTLAAMQSLGATVVEHDGVVDVTGGALGGGDGTGIVIDVGNSGTGIRLLAGLVAGLRGRLVLDGDASIRTRPMDRIVRPLREMGADIDGRDDGRFAPLAITGRQLRGIDYVSPVASAQVKSAVLIAGLAASGPTTVREPAVTRRHTEEMLAARGAAITVDGLTTHLEPSALTPKDENVPGDPSQAAFWLAAAAAMPGSDVTVADVYLGPARDGFLELLRRMGAQVEVIEEGLGAPSVRVIGTELEATDITPADVPGLIDEIPVLAVTAALAHGVTTLRGAAELRVKESDRLATVAAMLRGFGVAVTEYDDGLDITGGAALRPAHIDSHGDHRIAMAAAMAALSVDGETVVDGFASVATSYPSFLTDLAAVAPGATGATG